MKKNRFLLLSVLSCVGLVASALAFAWIIAHNNALASQLSLPIAIVLFLAAITFATYLLRLLSAANRIYSRSACDLDGGSDGKYNGIQAQTGIILRMMSEFSSTIEKDMSYNSEILIKKAEISALQSQINPHILYNTMDSIRGMALKYNVEIIADMAEALSSWFRCTINTRDEFNSFSEELENLSYYMRIQRYRFQERFQVTYQFQDEDAIMDIEVPKLILQPIVENSIYHGLEPQSKHGDIVIKAYLTDRNFVISISDNGIGLDAKALTQLNARLVERHSLDRSSEKNGRGIALVNINERIKLYYGGEYGLTVYSTVGMGTTVTITLPMQKN